MMFQDASVEASSRINSSKSVHVCDRIDFDLGFEEWRAVEYRQEYGNTGSIQV